MFFRRKGRGRYTRHTIRSSRWLYCLFYRFLVFFFRRRLRISSFFSYPKQARRRRRGRKSRCRIFITYFYRRFFLDLLGLSILYRFMVLVLVVVVVWWYDLAF